MPTTAKLMGLISRPGANDAAAMAKAAPATAPKNRLGEKTPPDAPDPRLKSVARSLAKKRKTRSGSRSSDPRSTASMVA